LPVFIKNIDEIGKSLPENTIFDQSILFLKGEFSAYITPADEPLIFKHFPVAKIKTISKAGHWLHAENPTDFFEQTLEFLKN
jgi:pimeloyl-ACP methyl ester carboxylesterase